MSERTLCNRCTLDQITADAERRGATCTVEREKLSDAMAMGSDLSWYVVRTSDRDEPVAYLMELTVRCCC